MDVEQPRSAPAAPLDPEEQALKERRIAALKQYGRGPGNKTKSIRDKKLRANLKRQEEKSRNAALAAKDAEILLEHSEGFLEPEGALERTYKVRQQDIVKEVGIEAAKKGFELKLNELGPYVAEYSRNGRDLLLAGRKGHIATMDWREGRLGCELQLNETVRDAKWLHNSLSFAVAQKRYVYIYDSNGVEIHRLDKHIEPTHLEFLPYHYLLATIGIPGWLRYTDTSTGQLVAEMGTKMGAPSSFAQNPYNAICCASIKMPKIFKQGKVAVVLSGRFAGKKVVVLKQADEGTKERTYPHAIVAGIERYPRKVTKGMGAKRIERRSKCKTFIRAINYNHLMPTRYALDFDGLKGVVTTDTFKEPEQRKAARKEVKKVFEDRYKEGKNRWFFTPLRF